MESDPFGASRLRMTRLGFAPQDDQRLGSEQRAPIRGELHEAGVPLAARHQLRLRVPAKTREQSHRERGVDLDHVVNVVSVEGVETPHGPSEQGRLFHDVVVAESQSPALVSVRRRCVEESPLHGRLLALSAQLGEQRREESRQVIEPVGFRQLRPGFTIDILEPSSDDARNVLRQGSAEILHRERDRTRE